MKTDWGVINEDHTTYFYLRISKFSEPPVCEIHIKKQSHNTIPFKNLSIKTSVYSVNTVFDSRMCRSEKQNQFTTCPTSGPFPLALLTILLGEKRGQRTIMRLQTSGRFR